MPGACGLRGFSEDDGLRVVGVNFGVSVIDSAVGVGGGRGECVGVVWVGVAVFAVALGCVARVGWGILVIRFSEGYGCGD